MIYNTLLLTHTFTIIHLWSNNCPSSILLSYGAPPSTGLSQDEEDGEKGDMAFLKDLLSPGPGGSDEFSKEWQDAFGMFDPPSATPAGTAATSGGQAACLPSDPPSPTGFLPSQLLDHSLSSTGRTLPSAGGTSFLHHTDWVLYVIQKQ